MDIQQTIENQIFNTLTLSPLTRQQILDILENTKKRVQAIPRATIK